jgi:predicted dehydrogenase
MLAAVTTYAATQSRRVVAYQDDKPEAGPNDKISVAVIGVNGRGQAHLGNLAGGKLTQVTHICDVDEVIGQKACDAVAEKQSGTRPTWVRDIRKLLEVQSLDAVTVATPNHWHSLAAIWSMQAGKDVYCEKPVSHNVSEGRRCVQAARKYKRICQTGTQSRSAPGVRTAIEYIHSGAIGDVKLARGLCYKRRPSIGPKGEYEVPKEVDYDLWSGPAPIVPLTRPKFHYDWHWQWLYGNGDLGNQGIHQMDVARWALKKDKLCDHVFSYGGRFGYEDAGETANTQIVVHQYGDQQLIFEVRGLDTLPYKGQGVGVLVEGTDGYVALSSGGSAIAFDKDGNEVKKFDGGGDSQHYQNFIEAMQSRDHTKLNADIEEGHLSSALCHLGNISFRMGQTVAAKDVPQYFKDIQGPDDLKDTYERTMEHLKQNEVDVDSLMVQVGPNLQFDPERETFVSADQASLMLTRGYRRPYVVPSEADL